METPAGIVVSLFGSEKAVSEICMTDLSSVYRWSYPKKRGGTDGRVPSKHHTILLMAAKERGVPLEPSHLIPKLPDNGLAIPNFSDIPSPPGRPQNPPNRKSAL